MRGLCDVIAGLDPAIHPEMDPRVKPAGDARCGASGIADASRASGMRGRALAGG
jgi:hypothetical protein